MTVAELIEKLKRMPPDALVLVQAEETDFKLADLTGPLEVARTTMTRQFMEGYPPEPLDNYYVYGDYVSVNDWDPHWEPPTNVVQAVALLRSSKWWK